MRETTICGPRGTVRSAAPDGLIARWVANVNGISFDIALCPGCDLFEYRLYLDFTRLVPRPVPSMRMLSVAYVEQSQAVMVAERLCAALVRDGAPDPRNTLAMHRLFDDIVKSVKLGRQAAVAVG